MNKKKKIFQRKVAFFVLATVMIIVAVLGNYGLRSAKKSAEEKESDNLMGYFVDTNPDYTERYQDELAEMALISISLTLMRWLVTIIMMTYPFVRRLRPLMAVLPTGIVSRRLFGRLICLP